MAVTRLVKFQLPVDVAIKLELQGAKLNMSIHEYCKYLLMSHESSHAAKQIDETHKMMEALYNHVFEVD